MLVTTHKTMMPIAVISDIHGNLPALQAVASDLRSRGVRKVLNLGDHLSGPLWPRETLAFLRRMDWTHIRGNHDRNLVEGIPKTTDHRMPMPTSSSPMMTWNGWALYLAAWSWKRRSLSFTAGPKRMIAICWTASRAA